MLSSKFLSVDRELCFVLMPFRGELLPVYGTIREAVILDNGLKCERADDIYSAGIVIDEVWTKICEAQLVVADTTGKNANVFYEMGLAHAIGKHVVLLAQSAADVPFDLQHRRVLLYEVDRLDKLRLKLARTIEGLRWRPPNITQWLPTSAEEIRVGLASPVDGVVVSKTPIEATGRVVGIPFGALRHRVQAFVVTDREYPQASTWIAQDGFWSIAQIHLGAREHRVSFRIYDEAGRRVAETGAITVVLEGGSSPMSNAAG
jgi:hypothetical protein